MVQILPSNFQSVPEIDDKENVNDSLRIRPDFFILFRNQFSRLTIIHHYHTSKKQPFPEQDMSMKMNSLCKFLIRM